MKLFKSLISFSELYKNKSSPKECNIVCPNSISLNKWEGLWGSVLLESRGLWNRLSTVKTQNRKYEWLHNFFLKNRVIISVDRAWRVVYATEPTLDDSVEIVFPHVVGHQPGCIPVVPVHSHVHHSTNHHGYILYTDSQVFVDDFYT